LYHVQYPKAFSFINYSYKSGYLIYLNVFPVMVFTSCYQVKVYIVKDYEKT